jgi:hypothetical protein
MPGTKTAQNFNAVEPGQPPQMIPNPFTGVTEGQPAMIPNPEYTSSSGGGTQPFTGQQPAYQAEANQDPWTFVQQLSPEQQALYDQDLRIRQGQGNVSEGMLQNVSNVYSKPENFAGMLPGFDHRGSPEYQGQQWQGPGYRTDMGSRDDAERAIYNRQMRYEQPLMDRRRAQEQDRLTAMGFNVNDPGYKNRMDDVTRAEDRYYADAIDRAILGGGQEATAELGRGLAAEQARFGAGQSEASNQFQYGLQGQQYQTAQDRMALDNALARMGASQQDRARLLNEMNAFRTGQQIQLPGTPGQTSTPNLQGVDFLGTAQTDYANQLGGYNAGQAGANNFMTGLFGLGSAALMGPLRNIF